MRNRIINYERKNYTIKKKNEQNFRMIKNTSLRFL